MQKRDSYENIQDFLSDESFQKWVKGNKDLSNSEFTDFELRILEFETIELNND